LEKVAIYARVSTEDQAERQTVQNQLEFLREFCRLYELPVQGEYVDDGWSGAMALRDRPDGRRLLEAAAEHLFDTVLVYRLDRLGRSLRALLEAHALLEGYGVNIRSATEPFDTSTPIGKFIFQLLGSIAELEKSTITERMSGGKIRRARAGEWNTGPIPFGYALDETRHLIPSPRPLEALGLTEAEAVREVFRRVAEGSTLALEARRFNGAGVLNLRRYHGGTEVLTDAWSPGRIYQMLTNPLYKGNHVIKSRLGGIVERNMTALVEPALWGAANARLAANAALSDRNAKHHYLLRGLITCALCGSHYCGTPVRKNGFELLYYRCRSSLQWKKAEAKRCPGKMIPVKDLDQAAWDTVKRIVRDSDPYLEQLQGQLRARLGQTADTEARRRTLLGQIAGKDEEKARVMVLFRRGRIGLEEAEKQLEEVAGETAALRQMLDALRSQAELVEASEAYLTRVSTLLAQLRGELEVIEQEGDIERKRWAIEALIGDIVVHTEGEGRHKTAQLELYLFGGNVTALPAPWCTQTCYIDLGFYAMRGPFSTAKFERLQWQTGL
jgi:site-specific DNA recombinase